MEKVFISGEDLKQFLLFLHGFNYDDRWSDIFKTQHPEFSREDLVGFQVAEEFNGKTILSLKKASSAISKAGLLFRPIYNSGDSSLDLPVPRLCFPFGKSSGYWGETKSKNYPDMDYPFLRIVGVEI